MRLQHHLQRTIARLTPDLSGQGVEPQRARFLTVLLLLGAVLGLLMPLALWLGSTHVAALCVAASATSLGLLWRLRHGAHFEHTLTLLLCLVMTTCLAPLLMEREVDGAVVASFAVLPYLAGLVRGSASAMRWLLLSLVGIGAVLLLRDGVLVPTMETTELLRAGRGLVLVMLHFGIALEFNRFRTESLAAVERADRSKSVFLANVSHEIRTPMNGVLGMAEVMLQSPLEPEQRERMLIVQRSGRALISLINDLLDLTKVEAGRLTIERTDFSLTELLSDLKQLFEPQAEQKALRLDLTVDDGVPAAIHADGLRLRQVLSNLLGNALKFTEVGWVHLRVGVAPRGLCFTVEDTGIGIPPEVLPRLFTAFSQADGGTTRRYGGTGLGLALSRQLVVMMGGELTVETGVGVGSRFHFTLNAEPAVLPVNTPPSTPRDPTPVPQALRKPVLVVDDNPINLKVACAMVQKAGFTTSTAANGKQAVEAVASGNYCLVLMDCHMPEMDGFEATERIRNLSGPASRTLVVALTASALPEELEACRRAGMADCLTKPLTKAGLDRMLVKFELANEGGAS